MSQENVEVVRRCLDAFQRGDFDAATDALDPRIEYDLTHFPDGKVYLGHDGVREAFRIWLGTWEDYRQEIDEVIDLGADEVVVVLREFGRGKGSGIEVERPTAGVWTLRDGKAVRIRFYAGKVEALEATGLSE
ncbi:MAG TPA: nuclear transport factor 2 family protein [Solirubrobacterales bacterium]|nr:nuclear transport factor 2 family protein [Solirubrobacterales bacterium]